MRGGDGRFSVVSWHVSWQEFLSQGVDTCRRMTHNGDMETNTRTSHATRSDGRRVMVTRFDRDDRFFVVVDVEGAQTQVTDFGTEVEANRWAWGEVTQ